MSRRSDDDWALDNVALAVRILKVIIGTGIAITILVVTLGLRKSQEAKTALDNSYEWGVVKKPANWWFLGIGGFLSIIGLCNLTNWLGEFWVCVGVIFIMLGVWLIKRGQPKSTQVFDTGDTKVELSAYVSYQIILPEGTSSNHELALKFMEQLLFLAPHLLLTIRGTSKGVGWYIVDPLNIESDVIEQLVHSNYSRAEVRIEKHEGKFEEKTIHRYLAYYMQPNMFIAPMVHLADLKYSDPLKSIAGSMGNLGADEEIIYCVRLCDTADNAYQAGFQMITQSTIHPLQFFSRYGMGDAIGKVATNQHRIEKFVPRDQYIFEDKLRQKLYRAMVIIQVDAPTPERVVKLTALLDTHLSNFTRMPYNTLQWVPRSLEQYLFKIDTPDLYQGSHIKGLDYRITNGQLIHVLQPPALVLEPRELAALWHLPHEEFDSRRIHWIPKHQVSLPSSVLDHVKTEDAVYVGTGDYLGKKALVSLHNHDRRTHINIIGKTGMGKSTLMHHLIHQDIEQGHGVAVIDPHGTLVKDILNCSIKTKYIDRIDEVVLIDLSNEKFPPPINPMRGKLGYTGIGRILSVFEQLFDDLNEYVRLAKYLRAAIGLITYDPQSTMRDISRVFIDDNYRYELLNRATNPLVLDVWESYDLQSEASRRQIHEPIISRIAPFYGNPTLYPMLCHPDTLDFRAMIRDKKIILISLAMSEDLVSEQERNLMGALLVSKLQMSGMHEVVDPFYIYIDEVQKFVSTSIDVVFSEARKFGLALTVANQYLGQLTGKTLDATLGNAGTTIAFRTGGDDAKTLGVYMRPQFDSEALVGLDQYTAAIKMQIKGLTQPAFTLYAPPPLDKTEAEFDMIKAIRVNSQRLYTPRTAREILDWLEQRYPRRRFGNTETTVQDYD